MPRTTMRISGKLWITPWDAFRYLPPGAAPRHALREEVQSIHKPVAATLGHFRRHPVFGRFHEIATMVLHDTDWLLSNWNLII